MNRALLITYDLKKPGQNYARLFDAIKRLGPWWHYLESTWIVDTPESVETATRALLEPLDVNDSVLVLDISNDAFNGWLPEDAWTWINDHTRKLVDR